MPRKRKEQRQTASSDFAGFPLPKRNYFRLPSIWIDITSDIDNLSELKVVQYILRHTWSFEEYGIKKRITIDEFISGRRRKDGSRMDKGTGLSEQSVRNGLKAALEHGWIEELVDDRDRGRVRKYYGLKMAEEAEEQPSDDEPSSYDQEEDEAQTSGVYNLEAGVQTLDPYPPNFRPRTPIQTLSTNSRTQTPNNFELQSQIFKTETRSKFSKKRKEKSQKSETEQPPEPAEPSRRSSDFSHVSQILPGRGVRAPAKNPSDASRNGSESAYYPSAGTKSQPAPETVSNRPRGKPKKYPVPPDLERFTTDITAEFHDASKLKSNLTFIGRVLQETGLHPNLLYQLMHEARQLTKGRGDIEKPSEDDPGFRNRWPYFRSTLLDLVEKEGRPVSARRQPRSGSP